MTEVVELGLVAAALYLAECVVCVPPTGTVFSTAGGASYRARRFGAAWGGETLRLTLSPPVPGLGVAHLAASWPISVDADRITTARVACPTSDARPLAAIRTARLDRIGSFGADRSWLLVDGERWARAASPGEAERLARWLTRLRGLPREDRAGAIEREIRARFDPAAAAERHRRFRRETRLLTFLTSIGFAIAFAVAPGVVAWRGLAATWPFLLAAFTPVWLLCVAEFWRRHRRLGAGGAVERWSRTLEMLLIAPAALRARDLLGRWSLAEFEPVAVAIALPLRAGARSELLRRTLRDARHPLPAPVAEWPRTAVQFHERWMGVLEEVVATWFGPAHEPAPSAGDEDARARCPRCGALFTHPDARCDTCAGLPLEPLPR